MPATVRVDRSLCRGTGLCEAMAPGLFQVSGAGYAESRQQGQVDDDNLPLVEDIADCCPTGAIAVTPTTGGRPLRSGEGNRDDSTA